MLARDLRTLRSELLFVCFFLDFMEGACLQEKRSDVALGMFCSRRKGTWAEPIKNEKENLPNPPTKPGEQKL